MDGFVSEKLGNMMGKGENAGYQMGKVENAGYQILPTMFSKGLFFRVVKT